MVFVVIPIIGEENHLEVSIAWLCNFKMIGIYLTYACHSLFFCKSSGSQAMLCTLVFSYVFLCLRHDSYVSVLFYTVIVLTF